MYHSGYRPGGCFRGLDDFGIDAIGQPMNDVAGDLVADIQARPPAR
jgi:hypothetical protein